MLVLCLWVSVFSYQQELATASSVLAAAPDRVRWEGAQWAARSHCPEMDDLMEESLKLIAYSIMHWPIKQGGRKKKKKGVKILRIILASFMSRILRYGLVLFLVQKPRGAKQREDVSV